MYTPLPWPRCCIYTAAQTRLDGPKPPPPPQPPKRVPRIPLDPRAIPLFVVNFTNLTKPCKPGDDKQYSDNNCPDSGVPTFGNLGTAIDQFGPVNWTTQKHVPSSDKLAGVAWREATLPWFGNLSVAGDGRGYRMYSPPDQLSTHQELLDYLYYK